MSSPAARILETALALQRDPGERFRLRERPLPAGLTHVLEVASGAPTAVRAAADTLGESEQTVMGAARFYLEQILFASPDADAYRVLGVAPDAPMEDIRTHHRWLQRWLHPDRAQAGDASVFATRVNQALAQLRTPELRHAYDVGLAEARLNNGMAPLSAATIRHWQFEETSPVYGRRSRWLLAGALGSCAVLAVLVLRHEEPVATWEPPGQDTIARANPTTEVVPAPEQSALEVAMATPPPPRAKTAPISTVGATEVETHLLPKPATLAVVPPSRAIRTALPIPAPTAPTSPRHVSAPVPTPAGTEVASVAKVEVAMTPEVATPAQSPDTRLLLERMRKAEQRVAQVTAYLAADPQAAPLWNDIQTQVSADRVRAQIAVAKGSRLNLAKPNWRLQTDNATLSVDYQCGSCQVPSGRLDVSLVWRQGLWLVRGVGLAPSA